MTDPDQIKGIDAKFAVKLQDASAHMTTTLETVPFDTINTSKQKSRQRARHGIEAYVKDAELDDPRVQALADFSRPLLRSISEQRDKMALFRRSY